MSFEWFNSQKEYQEAQHQAWEHFKLWVQSEFLEWFGKLSREEQEVLYNKFIELDVRKEWWKQLSNDKSDFYKQELKSKEQTIDNLQAKITVRIWFC